MFVLTTNFSAAAARFAELTSGLRAEKAHVAQLRRQIELLRH